ncbi:MAG: pyridoxamine 5'-phosphate oxidase family protein [Solirubrobacterales bacterium]|nr:pyridoxamine 5'-phosphate oxidase family protein [Solirubrobacterales bacterium]MBV9918532.1 pyridoxamine 5'-phosphate oxidase family protein [Solirubrobacterales bacterium]
MTTSLPQEIQAVFDRFVTTELTTVDSRGQPITWPVTPYYAPGSPCIDVTTGLGYPKKANDAGANPLVSLLFSDPTGSGLADPPMVLVQGSAEVDDRDLEANRRRYARESIQKLPATAKLQPPEQLQRFLGWYYTRIYIHVRPERVYVWPRGDVGAEPELYGAHMEEVRSGHSEEPTRFHAAPEGGTSSWDRRIYELGGRYRTAVVSIVSPDGFPFAVRVPVSLDGAARWIKIDGAPVGIPLQPGLACLTAHEHSPDFTWQQNFQIRGDLVRIEDGWALLPHKLIGGFELPPSRLQLLRDTAAKTRRFRRTAKRELAKRA